MNLDASVFLDSLPYDIRFHHSEDKIIYSMMQSIVMADF